MSVFKDDTLIRLRLEDFQEPSDMKLAACNFVAYRLKEYTTQSDDDKSDFLTNYVKRQDKRD